MTDTEHDTVDTAQAVIEAARAVMKHVTTEIVVDRETKETRLDVSIQLYRKVFGATFEEADDLFPDTLLGTLAGLVAALEAHDEATIGEDE